MKIFKIILLSSIIFSHDGDHTFLTPYISPGVQIGFNSDKFLFLSCQLTLGSSFKMTSAQHFEDTFPLFIGGTGGLRFYYKKSQPLILFQYYDIQLSSMFGGLGVGRIKNKDGEYFRRKKYWLGSIGLLHYEKIYFDKKIEKNYSLFGVLPIVQVPQ